MSQPPDTDREWQLQEQALRAERRGASALGAHGPDAGGTGISNSNSGANAIGAGFTGVRATGASATGAGSTGMRATEASATESTSTLAQYRLIARALRNPPIDPLPQDFAASTAAQVEHLAAPVNDRLEMWLQRLLLAILLLVGLVMVVRIGHEWILLAATGIGFSLLIELVWRSRSQSRLSRAL